MTQFSSSLSRAMKYCSWHCKGVNGKVLEREKTPFTHAIIYPNKISQGSSVIAVLVPGIKDYVQPAQSAAPRECVLLRKSLILLQKELRGHKQWRILGRKAQYADE